MMPTAGWECGSSFTPDSEPNEVVVHVSLLENDTLLQQYTLGSLGVNLIYACYHFLTGPTYSCNHLWITWIPTGWRSIW
jgi:hypothetical protein